MKVLFLMGGHNIDHKGSQYPVYMTEFDEDLIIERQISSYQALDPQSMVFCIRREDIRNFSVDDVIRQSAENAVCVGIGDTRGAICTALLAAEYIDGDNELIIVAADEMIEAPLADAVASFRARGAEAGAISFKSVHPRYSFARLDDTDQVCEVAEKRPISRHALASFYYFRKSSDFIKCAMNVVRKDNALNDSFYISQALNEMILEQKKVVLYPIESKQFHPLKTEMQMAQYILDLKEQRESR